MAPILFSAMGEIRGINRVSWTLLTLLSHKFRGLIALDRLVGLILCLTWQSGTSSTEAFYQQRLLTGTYQI